MTTRDEHGEMKHTPLLTQYLQHLRREVAPTTHKLYSGVLWRAHRELPTGVVAAGEDDLAEWAVRETWSPATRRTYLNAVTGLHHWLYRRGLTSYDPALLLPRVKVPQRLPRPYTVADVERILTGTTGAVRLAAHVATYAGARTLEVVRLHRQDVTAENIRLHGKGDRERAVPCHPLLWRTLRELPAGPVLPEVRTAGQLSDRCRHAFRQLGLRGGLHRLRHTFATLTLAAERDLRAVQELLGHASPATTAMYAAAQDSVMRAAVAALPDLAGGSTDDDDPEGGAPARPG